MTQETGKRIVPSLPGFPRQPKSPCPAEFHDARLGEPIARAAASLLNADGVPRAAARAVEAFPGETLVIPTGHEKVRVERHALPVPAGQRLLLPDGQRRARLRARAAPTEQGGRRPRARALRRAEPRPHRRDVLHRSRQGRALGRPPPRRAARAARASASTSAAALAELGDAARARVDRRAPARVLARRLDARSTTALAERRARQGARRRRSPRCACSRTRIEIARAARGRSHSTKRGFEDVIRAPARREDRARGRGHLQPARARRGQRRRLRHHRRVGPARLHAALDAATTARSTTGDAAAARRRRRGQLALHGRHHPHAADRRQVHQGAARDLRAGLRGAAGRVQGR